MKVTWEVDEGTKVEAKYGSFGKEIVSVNGREVINHRRAGKQPTHVQLGDGRTATILFKAQFLGSPEVRLMIDGRTYAPLAKGPLKCQGCGAGVRSFDRFCDACGKALPTAETRMHERHVRDATNGLFLLAGMFTVFGALMFFVTQSQSNDALANLAAMGASDTLEVEGQAFTVAELREQVAFEPWGVLITNAVLAVVMIGLGFWGRSAPLPAILVATAVYAMVIVTNAIVDPKTIGQGIILKIIVIMFLVKGIKAALALRAESNASPVTP
jgi:hypothetical protein